MTVTEGLTWIWQNPDFDSFWPEVLKRALRVDPIQRIFSNPVTYLCTVLSNCTVLVLLNFNDIHDPVMRFFFFFFFAYLLTLSKVPICPRNMQLIRCGLISPCACAAGIKWSIVSCWHQITRSQYLGVQDSCMRHKTVEHIKRTDMLFTSNAWYRYKL